MWKRLLGAMLVLDVAAGGLFLVYVDRRDTASASPSSEPSPCPTPIETLDPVSSPTPAVTLQVSPAATPSITSSGSVSLDPGVLEEGDHFGEEPSPSPSPSRSGSARPSGSPSPSPSVAERGPTSPHRLAAQVASAAPLPSPTPLPSSGVGESPSPAASAFPSPSPLTTAASPTPLSTPTLTSPTPLTTIPISPTPFECATPVPSLLAASPSPSPLPTTATAAPSPSASALAHADTPYENATLGYTFSYPESWILRVNGSLTELLDPGRQALVSFGRGPAGSLSKASDAYFGSLRQRYSDYDPSFTQVETISGAVARVMVGRATNEDGQRLRFRVVLIHGEDENFAVASFVALDISSSVQAALDEIIGSFELPTS